MTFTKIVSANFHDRGGRNTNHPWLIRDFNQRPDQAVPAKAVVATGVAFCPSSDHERGFGCATVAFCETADVVEDHSESGVRLAFLGYQFLDPDQNPISTCLRLLLNADGSMYAELVAAPTVQKVFEEA